MVNAYGCADFVMEDCQWATRSTFGSYDQTGGSHPYGTQFLGGVNHVIVREYRTLGEMDRARRRGR